MNPHMSRLLSPTRCRGEYLRTQYREDHDQKWTMPYRGAMLEKGCRSSFTVQRREARPESSLGCRIITHGEADDWHLSSPFRRR